MRILCSLLWTLASIGAASQAPPGRSVDAILADYIKAVGGLEVVDRFNSREIQMDVHHGKDITIYWQKPNLVLSLGKKERVGYDGARCWTLSSKSKVKKLPRGAELPLQMEANALRFVHLKDLYENLNPAPAEEIDGKKMDVIIAPNSVASTKLYFDANTHLLRRVEEKGEISVYFVNTFDYLDYQEVDGARMPYHIIHSTTEPEGRGDDLRVKQITHNVKLQTEMFSKPLPGQVVLGGKR